ncbi:MAG: protein kinase [Phycisphaeraceae bacterium]|nr:protein kinase [Phycisphaeraceae bacterium]
MPKRIDSFNFPAGRKVGARFVIEARLGGGSEGEVYKIRELDTGITRAAKFYFPQRDPTRQMAVKLAQKLNTLRYCPIVMQYHHSEIVRVGRQKVIALISDLCEGEPLENWIARHPGKRLTPYVALHVLFNLVRGLETIHALGEYHADVHSQNILIRPRGVRFDLKLIDFYDWGKPSKTKQGQDVGDAIGILYECLGGRRHYAKQPPEIKEICAGMKYSLQLRRFPTMTALRKHLETFPWESMV